MADLRVVLVLTVLIGTALSLTCYTCSGQSSNTNCMTATNCSASQTFCKTSVIAGGIGSLSAATITKTCESICTSVSLSVIVVSTSVSCCSSDLCNTSGTAGIKPSSAALALSLGFLLLLLRKSSL